MIPAIHPLVRSTQPKLVVFYADNELPAILATHLFKFRDVISMHNAVLDKKPGASYGESGLIGVKYYRRLDTLNPIIIDENTIIMAFFPPSNKTRRVIELYNEQQAKGLILFPRVTASSNIKIKDLELRKMFKLTGNGRQLWWLAEPGIQAHNTWWNLDLAKECNGQVITDQRCNSLLNNTFVVAKREEDHGQENRETTKGKPNYSKCMSELQGEASKNRPA
jgi:hypothetical protein